MNIEKFLTENGRKYDLRVIGKTNGKLHIEVQTREWDGDDSTQYYLVSGDKFIPITDNETNKEDECL